MHLVAAEDTRTTLKLLNHLGLKKELVSLHEHSPPERIRQTADRLSKGDVALVSEAGTPCISDPGSRLVELAREAGAQVSVIPGPSAVSAALSVSGLPADTYTFLGFLPRRRSDRRELLATVAKEHRTLVVFETPHRLRAALDDLLDALGDRTLCIARELTKLHEEIWHGSLSEAGGVWSQREPRGEFTLVIAGAADVIAEPWDDARVRSALAELRDEGLGAREASRLLAREAGRPARDIYRLWEHNR